MTQDDLEVFVSMATEKSILNKIKHRTFMDGLAKDTS